jgi:aldehyde:ferredoxin oxidoreductase
MGVPVSDYAEAYRAATGIERDERDLLHISERIWNLTRMFWVREVPGFGRSYDLPPARVYQERITGGPTRGAVLEREKVEAMLDDYYSLRGWTKDGIPTEAKLRELGLDWVLDKTG